MLRLLSPSSSSILRPSSVGLLLLLLVCAQSSTARAQAVVGTVSQLRGSAELMRGGRTLAVTAAMAVELHDRIATRPASGLTITLSDSSTLTLGESSTLVIDENVVTGGVRASTKLSLLGGSVLSFVTSALRGAAPTFEVHTPNAIVGVRGTRFKTLYSEGIARPAYGGCTRFTDVATYQGIVGVRNPTSASAAEVEVPEGYETTVACTSPPLSAGPLGLAGARFTLPPPGAGGSAPPPPLPPVKPLQIKPRCPDCGR